MSNLQKFRENLNQLLIECGIELKDEVNQYIEKLEREFEED